MLMVWWLGRTEGPPASLGASHKVCWSPTLCRKPAEHEQQWQFGLAYFHNFYKTLLT